MPPCVRLLLVSVLLAALQGPATAAAAELRVSPAEVRREVVAVIEGQLQALRERRVDDAYALASTPFRAQRTRDQFAGLVRQGYPEIWASTRAESGSVRDDGRRATAAVRVYSQAGDVDYDYALVREPAGWRIHGVVRRPRPAPKREA